MTNEKAGLKVGRKATRSARLLSYGVALLSVALALKLTLLLEPLLHTTPAQLFFVAVMVSAWYGGMGPGLLATVLSSLAVNYFLIEPHYSLAITNPATVVQLATFIMSALLISGLNESRRIAIRREQTLRTVSEAAQSEAQTAKDRLEIVLSSIDDAFYFLDRDWRYTYVNDRLCEIVGIQREQILGYSFWDLFPDVVDTDVYTQFHRALSEQKPSQAEYFYAICNRWYSYRIYPSPNGLTVFTTDITEAKHDEIVRKQAEESLLESENRLQMALSGARQGIWDWDLKRQILTWDEHCKEIFGLPPDFAVTYEWHLEALHPDDRPRIQEALAVTLRDRTEFNQEYRTFHPNHTMRWILARGRGFFDAAGEPYRMSGTVMDITDRKQAEEALRESEARFRQMTDSAPMLVWMSGIDKLCYFFNQPWLDFTGRTMEQELGNGWLEGVHPDDLQRCLDTYTTAFDARRPFEMDYRLRRFDGEYRWILDAGIPRFTSEGQFLGYIGSCIDIGDRKRADERLNLLYETTRDLLATEQPMQLMSNLFSKLSDQLELHYYYNYMVEEKDNRPMLHLRNYEGISDEVAESIEWIEFSQYLCGLVAQERRQIGLDQTQISNHPNAQLLCSAGVTAYAGQPLIVKGRLLGTLSFSSRTRPCFTPEELDLLRSTCEQMAIAIERANLITSIQQQAEQLQRANRIKDEFLAVLSHELRSPLNPILGWSKLLRNRQLDAQKTDYALEIIERNAQIQARLINDLLDVSRILQGKLSLNAISVYLVSTIQAAIETVRLAAVAKSIQIDTLLDPEVGQVWGDPDRLQQVVWNLLSNAVKFTPPGGRVSIQLKRLDSQAQIAISDTGKGIDSNFLPHVFDRFRQEDAATTRRFGGLGLGLAIVRHLVELHGGTVYVDSLGEGQGATFTIKLPLMPQQPTLNPDAKPYQLPLNLNGIKVLVVDDDDSTREFIDFLLNLHGASVTAVASASKAFAVLPQFNPDVLLSDIGMPDIDGYMLMRQVRALPSEQGGQIPAIALTAFAGEIDYQQAITAGFQTHLSKPIEPDTLVQAIVSLVKTLQS